MQIREIKSEALQATIRRLFPSQAGFSEDLQASNLITPIVDVTPTAEGTQLPFYLQQALDFNSSTFFCSNATISVTSTPGFYRVFGVVSNIGGVDANGSVQLTDGLTTRIIFSIPANGDSSPTLFDFIVFVNTGQTLQIKSDNATLFTNISLRQVADLNGNLTNPSGFTFE